MAQTVIGFFDRGSDAQDAVRELMSRGIARDRIDLRSGRSGSTSATGARAPEGDRSSISGFFRNLFGVDQARSDRYRHVAEHSDTIVTVHAVTQEEADIAVSVLDRSGAIDVDERARASGFASREEQRAAPESSTIPRIEEQLHVGKRDVEAGGVRVRSHVIEKPVEENIRLREEHVRVERQAVDRPVSEHERVNQFRERDIELTERAEVPVIHKQARVVEEVRIRTEVSERDETIHETVRRTDIDVEQIGDGTRSNTENAPGIGSAGRADTGSTGLSGGTNSRSNPGGTSSDDRGHHPLI